MKRLLPLVFSLAMLVIGHAQTNPDYTLHEWGTFTTLCGSDGRLLTGLQREEEGLPPFVESLEGMENLGGLPGNAQGKLAIKGYIRPLKNVTVKMETPVIYFYTDHPFQAKVSVGFHGGSISQWYPSRSGGEIPPGISTRGGMRVGGEIDFAQKYEGSIQWDIAVTPHDETDSAAVFRGGETANWLFPRQPDSALLRAGNGMAEKFLFYRGVGNFDLPLVTRMEKDRVLTIQNRGDQPIPRFFVYEMGEGMSARFQLLDALPSGASAQVDLDQPTASGKWQQPVYQTLVQVLTDAGLYRKEADAMLQTWWQSYFMKPGLRVFWIVPESFTEKILPLTVDPAPKKITRVLVGRSEVLTPKFERDLVRQTSDANVYLWKNERYSEAYAERLRELTSSR